MNSKIIRRWSVCVFAVFFVFVSNAFSHVVGTSEWCLANSPVHYECFLSDQDRCEKEAHKRTTPLEEWRCVSYPIDFSKIPRSGESIQPQPLQQEQKRNLKKSNR